MIACVFVRRKGADTLVRLLYLSAVNFITRFLVIHLACLQYESAESMRHQADLKLANKNPFAAFRKAKGHIEQLFLNI